MKKSFERNASSPLLSRLRKHMEVKIRHIINGILTLVIAAIGFQAHGVERAMPVKEMTRLGYKMLEKGEVEEARHLYMSAIEAYSPGMGKEELRECIKAYSNLGYICLFESHSPEQAYILLSKAKEMATENRELDLLGAIYGNLAKLYDDFGDTHEALANHRKGMEAAYSQNSNVSNVIRLMVFDDLANMAVHRGLTDSIADCLDMFRKDPPEGIAMSQYSKKLCDALALAADKRYREAATTLINAEGQIDKSVDQVRYRTNNLLAIASFLDKAGDKEQALYYLLKAKDEVAAQHLADLRPRVLGEISRLKKESGDIASAKEYRLLALEATDSLYSARDFGKIRYLESAETIDNLSRKIETAQTELNHKRILTWILTGGILLIVSLLVILAVYTRRLGNSHVELVRRHRETLAERKHDSILRQEYAGRVAELEKELSTMASAIKMPTGDDSKESEKKQVKIPGSREEHLALAEKIKEVFENDTLTSSPDFSLDFLAETVGSKPKYVSTIIKDTLGSNFSNLLAEARVATACRLMTDPDFSVRMSIDAVAEATGYRSRTHFSSIFKKITGLTPGQYISAGKKDV